MKKGGRGLRGSLTPGQVLGRVVEEAGLDVKGNLWSSQQWCYEAESTKDTGDSMHRLRFQIYAVLKIWARFGLAQLSSTEMWPPKWNLLKRSLEGWRKEKKCLRNPSDGRKLHQGLEHFPAKRSNQLDEFSGDCVQHIRDKNVKPICLAFSLSFFFGCLFP